MRLSRGNSFKNWQVPLFCLVPCVGGGRAGAGMSPHLSQEGRRRRGTECLEPQIWSLKGRVTRQGHKTSAFWTSHKICVHPCWLVTTLEQVGGGERCFEAAWERVEGMVGCLSPADFFFAVFTTLSTLNPQHHPQIKGALLHQELHSAHRGLFR